MSRSMTWQVAALLLQPPLSGVYLLAMRAEVVGPSYFAALFFTAVPGLALGAGAAALRGVEGDAWRWQAALIGLAVLEVAWGLLTFAIVAFAIAWRLE
jgi:hypothetical protein